MRAFTFSLLFLLQAQRKLCSFHVFMYIKKSNLVTWKNGKRINNILHSTFSFTATNFSSLIPLKKLMNQLLYKSQCTFWHLLVFLLS